jgi:hypothetical protein
MKLNVQFVVSYCGALAATVTLSGCMDAGSVLAEESGKFGICALDQGQNCQVHSPDGTKVEKASVASTNDAVRILGAVSTASECEGFAAHAKSHSPKHIAQATINNIVVMPYGEVMPHGPSVKTACATPPYNVSLTVAKAP